MEAKLTDFEAQLKYGKDFENRCARWFMGKGYHVIPKYLYTEEGAPLLIGKYSKHAIPDLDIAKNGERIWVECKRKNKMKCYPATGYSLSSHENYKKVQQITGDRVFIIFEDRTEKKRYGNWIDELEKEENVFAKMSFGDKVHILFKYPGAFIEIEMGDNSW